MGKNLDPNIKPEKQHANPVKGSVEKPCIGQGRAGLRRRRSVPINQTIISPSKLSQKTPGETKIETEKTNHVNSTDPIHSISNADEGMAHTRPLIPDVPFHPGLITDPLLNLLDPICLKVRKVCIVQKILAQILI